MNNTHTKTEIQTQQNQVQVTASGGEASKKQLVKSKFTPEYKGDLIQHIVQQLKISAIANNDFNFCEGDVFFSLAFKSDQELERIARLAGVTFKELPTIKTLETMTQEAKIIAKNHGVAGFRKLRLKAPIFLIGKQGSFLDKHVALRLIGRLKEIGFYIDGEDIILQLADKGLLDCITILPKRIRT